MPPRPLFLAALLLLAPTGARSSDDPPPHYLIRGGRVIDGTGAPGYRADLALRGDRITAIGEDLPAGDRTRIIDATDRIVAPGFIDLHSHSDGPILKPATRANANFLTQGVATVVTGNCGSGPIDAGKFFAALDKEGAGTNVILLIGHGSIRRAVLGNGEKKADAAALAKMAKLIDDAMNDGAWGLSTGLIYLPGRYADTAELVALSKVVARHGGLYASHIRDEGSGLLTSIDEALTIGREAKLPIHISHLKATGRKNWGLVVPACQRIADARAAGMTVTADQYPYTASSTQLSAMVVPHWARQGTAADFARLAADPRQGPRLRAAIDEDLRDRDGGAMIRIARYSKKPSRVGKDLAAIAREEGTTPLEIVLDIERNGGAQAISFGMSEDDVRHVMRQDFVATASDGSAHARGAGDKPHPRAYGTFPAKIRYALDENVIPLEAAIRAATGLPAAILGLPDRGTIRLGNVADLVVFDPDTFRDRATFDDPTRYATGIDHLFVNGRPAISRGEPTRTLAGRALRRHRDGPADLIVKIGRIWTGDPENPWAQALASRAGEIVAVGDADDIMRFRGPMTRLIDRPDAFAIPGLIDAHGHMASLGSSLEQIDLRGIASPEEIAQRVKRWSEDHPGDGWIIGHNWDQSLWPGGAFSNRGVLDATLPDRPVWLTRVDGHAGWANSAALKLAGVTAESKAPSDGQILRDPEGRPTGVCIDGAMGLVTHAIPDAAKPDLMRQLLAAQDECLQVGLTGVHDAGLSRAEIDAYRELDRDGRLKLRIYGMASPPGGDDAVEFVSKRPPPAGKRFELRAIKLFIDGAMGSRGGLLFEPYSDDPGNAGLQLIDQDLLRRTTEAALRHGWQVCTHAIGDKGNALVLDAYEAARKAVPEAADPRLRIEHAQVVRRSDVPRFRALGVIASMQPSHASDDMRWADARLGPGRVDGAYAWSWFRDDGVRLAFGSDFPVEVVTPFWGLYAALTRQDEKGHPDGGWHPEHRLTLEETLRAHTAGAAHAAFAENRLGVLKPGLRADLTILDRDPFRASPAEILKAVVLETIIDGEQAYSRAE